MTTTNILETEKESNLVHTNYCGKCKLLQTLDIAMNQCNACLNTREESI